MPYKVLEGLNHRHEQIVNWLVCNPDRSLGECAAFFGYTRPWITSIVHSDMFQMVYQARCREVGVVAVHGMVERLTTVAGMALDETERRLKEGQVSERGLGEVLNMALKATGYLREEKPAEKHQHLHLFVDATSLREARERAASRFLGEVGPQVSPPANASEGAYATSPSEDLVPVRV
jgi:hypothetical protein